MFFADHEKAVYSPDGTDLRLDPLAVRRSLVLATDGQINSLLAAWDGDDEVAAAHAEESLVRAARDAFSLPPFPEATDGEALDALFDYLEWMEGKGSRESRPPKSSASSDSPPASPTSSSSAST